MAKKNAADEITVGVAADELTAPIVVVDTRKESAKVADAPQLDPHPTSPLAEMLHEIAGAESYRERCRLAGLAVERIESFLAKQ